MPRKLFISYPSESWNFAQRIAESLASHVEQAIFIDYRSIDQADFAEAILSHLRDSDALILVVTEYTFADIHRDNDWVRLEIRTALKSGIPIVLVRENGLLPPKDLPDDVRDVNRSQGVPFYREFFEPGLVMLAEFLIRIQVATPRRLGPPEPIQHSTVPPEPQLMKELEPQRRIAGHGSIEEAADLLEAGDFEKALVILSTLREGDELRPVYFRLVDNLIAKATELSEYAARRREAELDYGAIASMARRKLTEATARAEFYDWCQTYPDLVVELDTEGLRSRFEEKPPRPAKTLDPITSALQRAEGFGGKRNGDWQPFVTTFSDLLIQDMPFCLVPVGTFQMGSDDGHYSNEKPVHEQRIARPYWIAQYPVTNAQWLQAVRAGAVNEPQDDTALKWYKDAAMADAPVVGVDWFMARDFAAWMRCRLPTEAEWEYAARGVESWRYPWGDKWEDGKRVVWSKTSGGRPNPVTSKPEGASWVDARHLIGNVWEWMSSRYQPYPYAADDGREEDAGSGTGVQYVLRGGSWNYVNTDYFRCAFRFGYVPHGGNLNFGFRPALSL